MSKKEKSPKELLEVLIPVIKIKCKNEKQKELLNIIDYNEITLCTGPAGTGKSHLSIAKALQLIRSKETPYQKLIIVNPAVEAEEKLGFLKGDLHDKLAPYTYSSISLVDKVIGKDNRKVLEKEGFIEIMALAFMRGWNCDDSILVMEEAQNTTPGQMKTLLTRIGSNTKYIISGDLEQSDRFKESHKTGLYDAMIKLDGLHNIGSLKFELCDVVRNPIISEILTKYDQANVENYIKKPHIRQVKNPLIDTKLVVVDKPKWFRRSLIAIKRYLF